MNKRFLSAFLVLATWVVTQCSIAVPAHACCPASTDHKLTGPLPACCMVQPAGASITPMGAGGTSDHTMVAVAPPSFTVQDWLTAYQQVSISRLAHHHMPDQSKLHSELSVWLN